jgi:hypothetical protein
MRSKALGPAVFFLLISASGITPAYSQSRPPMNGGNGQSGYNPGNPGGNPGGSGYNPGGSGGSGYHPGGTGGSGYNPGYGSGPNYGDRPPPHTSITLYEHSRFRGSSYTLRGPQSNLARSGFANRVSSFRAYGLWQLCDLPNFHGRCIVRSGDVLDLAPTGLNDRISSARPWR